MGEKYMKVIDIQGGLLGTNTYLVVDDAEKEALLVDPVLPVGEISAYLPCGARITAALLTHGHFDHIEALASYKEAGIPIFVHREDEEMLSSAEKNGSYRLLARPIAFSFGADGYLEDGKEIPLGSELLTVMHLPGHTKGSIALWGDGFVLSGDTVFAFGDYGRCDLYGGDEEKMQASLRRFFSQTGEYVIYAGHGGPASYSREKILRKYPLDE